MGSSVEVSQACMVKVQLFGICRVQAQHGCHTESSTSTCMACNWQTVGRRVALHCLLPTSSDGHHVVTGLVQHMTTLSLGVGSSCCQSKKVVIDHTIVQDGKLTKVTNPNWLPTDPSDPSSAEVVCTAIAKFAQRPVCTCKLFSVTLKLHPLCDSSCGRLMTLWSSPSCHSPMKIHANSTGTNIIRVTSPGWLAAQVVSWENMMWVMAKNQAPWEQASKQHKQQQLQ